MQLYPFSKVKFTKHGVQGASPTGTKKLKKIFDIIKEKQKIIQEQMVNKKKKDEEYELRKKAKEAEELAKGSKPLTAHEKRIAHQKLKQQEKLLTEQNDQ